MPQPVKVTADFEVTNSNTPVGEPWMIATATGHYRLTYYQTEGANTNIGYYLTRPSTLGNAQGNVTTAGATDERQPAGALLADGRHVVVWTEEAAGGGGSEDVYAAVYDTGFFVVTPRFLVAGGAGRQHDPVVAAIDSPSLGPSYVIALNDDSVAGGQLILKYYVGGAQLWTTAVAPNAPQTVNQGSADLYRDVEITGLQNGNFVVTWCDASFNIFARVYASSGAISGVFEVDAGNPVAFSPDVTTLADGRFVITYVEIGASTVRGRLFNPDGTASGASFAIGAGAGSSTNQQAQTAALDDGRFMTVWQTAGGDIAGQVMFANGTPDGTSFIVNTNTSETQSKPTIATLADGRVAVAWESNNGETLTVVNTVYDPREAGIVTSASPFADEWRDTNFNDTIFFGAGNDRMVTNGGGNDTFYGEDGNDVLGGGLGSDKLYGGDGGDQLFGGSQADRLEGGLGADQLFGNDDADTCLGDDGNDQIDGGNGNDRIYGGNGDDVTLVGGIGNDAIYGGNGNDTINGAGDKDTLNGDAGNDILFGTIGADTIKGGSDNDRLNGGADADVLAGGTGADIFVYFDATEGNDRIDDWLAIDDQLEIDASNFSGGLAAGALAANRLVVGAAPAANQAFGQFLYNTANGQLLWDIDGTGATAAVAITRLLNGGVAVGTLAVGDFDIVA